MRTNNFFSMLFGKFVPLLVLLSLSTAAAAEVFKCVDKATGKTSFTDKACPDDQPGQYHHVAPSNSDSAYDPQATSNLMNRGATQHKNFQTDYKNHNEKITYEEHMAEKRREQHRSEVVDKDVTGLTKDYRVRNHDLGVEIYKDHTRDNDSDNDYERK